MDSHVEDQESSGVFRTSAINGLCEREREIGHVIICDGVSDGRLTYCECVVQVRGRGLEVKSCICVFIGIRDLQERQKETLTVMFRGS